MEYVVQVRDDEEIIFASASGEWDADTDNRMVHEILEKVDSNPHRNVLLDIRELQFDLPMVQFFERANELRGKRKQFSNPSRKVAIVYPSGTLKLEQGIEFFETAARNRGLPYRTFKDMKEAIDWLKGES